MKKICTCSNLMICDTYTCQGKFIKRNRNSVICSECGRWESSFTNKAEGKIGKPCKALYCKECKERIII